MSGLPPGWGYAQLQDVCSLVNGRAYKQEELLSQGKYPVLRVGNFFSNPRWYFSDLELEEEKYCHDGDLLYAWSASFGPKVWRGEKTIFHYHIWRVQLDDRAIDKKFLYYWFLWDKENIKADHGTGSTMIHVTKGDMEERPIALPPLAEQRRIVAKLETLTARTARSRADLDRVPALAARYKQAVLAKAFNGELISFRTVAEPVTVEGVAAQIFDGPFGSNLKSDDYVSSGVRVVRLENIAHLAFVEHKQTYITEAKFDGLRRHSLQAGDVLFSSFVDEQVRVCVLPMLVTPAINKADCFCVRLDRSRCDPGFLAFRLASPSTFKHFEAQVHGATRPRINLRQLKAFEFDLPSLDMQAAIVGRIERAFVEIERLTAEAAAARRLLDRLDQAILAKAFRGELVPQDATDEPASVLLDRIRAERAAAPKPKRKRTGRLGNKEVEAA